MGWGVRSNQWGIQKELSEQEQQEILLNYRLAYLAETMVNWCSALGTVLANDEVVNGLSEIADYMQDEELTTALTMIAKIITGVYSNQPFL